MIATQKKILFKKAAWLVHMTPKFRGRALNANSSKTVKVTDFKFQVHVPRDNPDMTPRKNFEHVRGQGRMTINI